MYKFLLLGNNLTKEQYFKKIKEVIEIIYLALGGAILAIILFIILFNNITGKKNSSNSNSPIAQKNSLDEYIEQANSSIGKKVNEEYQDLDENEGIQVQVNDEKKANVEKENGDETKKMLTIKTM